ncbi:uncharacterized protein FOMMEDRAFT_165425 [Fomitiporia mediterranea MF3/22]|uniref:uncharacterized protein n=1 Tax=Fomitiporia mediterranea (strain MF3/22) TaxID=694068 RepID=UPI0004407E3F|nr:uncharacterized protein FOMMEDRAFT_165425 [Fomitiporia mediterranea MF3/22]EJD06703.1 hypothetical protein FOMMEDRAFT_165425 [Fomitiporia mediterranea MF3/22]
MDVVQFLDKKAQEVWLWRYTLVSTLCFVVYEHLITIDAEINTILPSKLSLPKILFFLNRYLPLVTAAISVHMLVITVDCTRLLYATSYLACSCYLFAEAPATLLIRVYAIWERKRSMLIFLSMIFAVRPSSRDILSPNNYSLKCAVAGVYSITKLFLSSASASPIRLLDTGCFVITTSRIEWAAVAILICCETAALTLLLAGNYFKYRNNGPANVIMKRMMTDGAMYYLVILLSSTVNLLALRFEDDTLDCIFLVPQSILHSILCNRLLLRIREAGDSAKVNIRVSQMVF